MAEARSFLLQGQRFFRAIPAGVIHYRYASFSEICHFHTHPAANN